MMELLAPAGSSQALRAAVMSGADAVYIGGKRFSARGSAENFSDEEIKEAAELCHLYGVKLHVAANILVKPDEADEFLAYMDFLNSAGVDAVIIQDIGMAYATHAAFPELPLHASTQMTAASTAAVKYLEKMGFSRVVTARELSREQIAKICRDTDAEIEVFAHGAICMCYSGQCLMSSIIGARSGNRGLCAQPCRLPYKYEKNGKVLRDGYLLSTKDMALIDSLGELKVCGVKSLKLEGRLKSPEYVSQVCSLYRKYIDSTKKVTREDMYILESAFSRSGFTDGYFAGRLGADMMSYKTPGNTASGKAAVPSFSRPRRGVDIYCKMCKGEKLYIKITDEHGCTAEAESEEKAEKANNRALSHERLSEQLSKLGGSAFEARSITLDAEENATIPIRAVNECRRRAVQLLEGQIQKIPKRERREVPKFEKYQNDRTLSLTAQVKSIQQLRACEEEGVEVIYIPHTMLQSAKNQSCQYAVILPEICDSDTVYDIPEGFGVLISNVGQELLYPKHKKYGNFRLNIFNSYSAQIFAGYEAITLSPELNMRELSQISTKAAAEVIGYGRLPLMIMKNCPTRAIEGKCANGAGAMLRDRRGEEFLMDCDGACHSVLLNSKKIYMADKARDFEKTAVSRIRLVFHDEDYSRTREIIREYMRGIRGEFVKTPPENTYTRCHFYRGVR